MTSEEITALAREYAEQTDGSPTSHGTMNRKSVK